MMKASSVKTVVIVQVKATRDRLSTRKLPHSAGDIFGRFAVERVGYFHQPNGWTQRDLLFADCLALKDESAVNK